MGEPDSATALSQHACQKGLSGETKLLDSVFKVNFATDRQRSFRLAVAVGTTITDRPPHKAVRAPLCIRLPPRMTGAKALQRIRMQDSRERNPMVEDRCELIPTQRA